MFSTKTFKLGAAFISVFVLLSLIAVTAGLGSSAIGGPLNGKLFRRRDKAKERPNASEAALLGREAGLQEPQKEQRGFDIEVPAHLTIKVNLKAEKEKAARDLENERWHRDLEIEVKNTGHKPIYYISLVIEIPEIKIGGTPVSVHMRYGQNSLFDNSKGQAGSEDVPLKRNETCVLKLDGSAVVAWQQWKEREKWAQPKKIVPLFEQLNFGDGTGFFGDNGAPWPLPKAAIIIANFYLLTFQEPRSKDPPRQLSRAFFEDWRYVG